MSMARCDACERFIDTDEDCERYVTVTYRNADSSHVARQDKCLCAHCRDLPWLEIEEQK